MVNEHLGVQSLPGLGPEVTSTSRKFITNNSHLAERGIRIDDATQDIGNTPVTKLRGGLVLVRVEAAGANLGKYVHVTHADAPAAGDIAAAVILMQDINMFDRAGVVEDKVASGLIHGFVTEASVIFGTADVGIIDAVKEVLPLVQFEA